MATNTYVALDKVTVASDTPSVTFSSIPQNYTDLRLVVSSRVTGAQNSSGMDVYAYYNSDQSTNYSMTQIYANGSSSSANRAANITYAYFGISSNSSSNDWPTFSVDIMNYSNTTTYKPAIARVESSLQSTSSRAILWKSTAAISSITFYPELSLSFKAGTTFSLYGIAASSVGAKATGGVISSDSQYWYHTFLSSGTLTPTQSVTADYLVVAGGGGGGSDSGGGGGAGGYKTSIGGSALSLSSGTAYTVTVGAGGSGSSSSLSNGTNGSNSVFSTITSTGGGFGGSNQAGYNGTAGDGAPGGSGGGAGAGGTGTGFHTPGAALPSGQGNAGGLNYSTGGGQRSGGGGGGAGAAGSNGAVNNVGGNGGNGLSNSITGTATYYAGGGGGTGASGFGVAPGTGGLGGGAAGNNGAGISGTANTGGGGGASDSSTGGSGGSGIVIVRYAK